MRAYRQNTSTGWLRAVRDSTAIAGLGQHDLGFTVVTPFEHSDVY